MTKLHLSKIQVAVAALFALLIASQIVMAVHFNHKLLVDPQLNVAGLDTLMDGPRVVVPSVPARGYPLYEQTVHFQVALSPTPSPSESALYLNWLIRGDTRQHHVTLTLVYLNGSTYPLGDSFEGYHVLTSGFQHFDGTQVSALRFDQTVRFTQGFYLEIDYVSLQSTE